MSNKKDLVEAHSFNRRRLITAFISGAPGGREVEPVRAGRTLIGGAVLAGIIIAGAAVSGFLKPTLPDDWTEQGLVVGKESGSRFLASKGTLYPIINTTSARLALPPGEFEPLIVEEDKIAEVTPGTTLGIPGAPDVIADREALIQTGWSACTDGQQSIKTRISTELGAQYAQNAAAVVEANGKLYVITRNHRYPVPKRNQEATLRALGLDGEIARSVPGVWLDLISPGEPLGTFAVDNSGDPSPQNMDAPSGLDTIGSVVRVDDRLYLLTAEGLLPISDFAYRMYISGSPGSELPEVEVDGSELGGLETLESTALPYPSDWPEESVTPYAGSSTCLLLFTSTEQAGQVFLASATNPAAVPSTETTGRREAEVESGHGALVRASGGRVVDRGTVYLIDSSGTKYALGAPVETTLAHLGYDGITPASVPLPWMDLFADGPVLDRERAVAPAGAQ